jgi:hypothetical protein
VPKRPARDSSQAQGATVSGAPTSKTCHDHSSGTRWFPEGRTEHSERTMALGGPPGSFSVASDVNGSALGGDIEHTDCRTVGADQVRARGDRCWRGMARVTRPVSEITPSPSWVQASSF